MKKSLCVIISYFLAVVLLASCTAKNDKYANLFKADYSDNNEIYYNYYTSKLLLLIHKDNNFARKENDEDIIQYQFSNNNAYYTSGSSTKNNFKIIKVQNSQIETLYELPNKSDDALFPFDEYDGKLYFIKTKYSGNTPQYSEICIYENNSLTEFGSTKCNSILSGTIFNDMVYYISVKDRNNKTTDIMQLSLKNMSAKPMVYKSNTKSGFLYRHNNHLIYTDDKYIYSENKKYDYKDSDYVSFVDSRNLMIKSTEKESGETIQVYDLNTGELVKQFPYCEGLKINDREIKLLYANGITTYKWGS